MIGALQRFAHIPGHRTRHHQHVGMARRGNEAQAEALDVVIGVVERVDLKFASVAGSGVDLAYRKAAAEPPPCHTADCGREFGHRGIVRQTAPAR